MPAAVVARSRRFAGSAETYQRRPGTSRRRAPALLWRGAGACLRRGQQQCCAAVGRRQGEANVGAVVRPRLVRAAITSVALLRLAHVTATVALACMVGRADALAAPLAYVTSTGGNAVVIVD